MEAPHGAGLMQAAHWHFIEKLRPRIRSGDPTAVERLLNWLSPPTPIEDHPDGAGAEQEHKLEGGAGLALDALLLPWRKRSPDPDIRRRLETRLVGAYGDPRIKLAGGWSACSNQARGVMLGWLCAATMELFFEIVTQAAVSHMWSDRKGLWIDLYEQGRITQAWFALSPDCADVADDLQRGPASAGLTFARNISKSLRDRRKTLLIMEIGGRWVVEGSHNFPTHIFPRTKIDSFKPYMESYTCDQFRHIRGREEPRRIRHQSNWKNEVLMELPR